MSGGRGAWGEGGHLGQEPPAPRPDHHSWRPSPQFWRAPVTSNSAKLGRPQPRSAGCLRHPEWTASKFPTNWRMEVIPFARVLTPSIPPSPCILPALLPRFPGPPPTPSMFAGEPQSVQVDGRGRTQKLEGLTPGARYEVTVVSMRGFEESEPLSGFLTTGERGWGVGRKTGEKMRAPECTRAGQGQWRPQWRTRGAAGFGQVRGEESSRGTALSPSPLPVPDGPTQLRALNLTEGSALLHWKPPQTPVDTYDVKVTASGGEQKG